MPRSPTNRPFLTSASMLQASGQSLVQVVGTVWVVGMCHLRGVRSSTRQARPLYRSRRLARRLVDTLFYPLLGWPRQLNKAAGAPWAGTILRRSLPGNSGEIPGLSRNCEAVRAPPSQNTGPRQRLKPSRKGSADEVRKDPVPPVDFPGQGLFVSTGIPLAPAPRRRGAFVSMLSAIGSGGSDRLTLQHPIPGT